MIRWQLRCAAVLVASVTVAVEVVVAPPAAVAQVRNLEVVSELSPIGPENSKTVSVDCPEDKVVIGGGGFVSPATEESHEVLLTALVPQRTRYTATGEKRVPGTSTNWVVRVIAICGTEPAGYRIRPTTMRTTNPELSVTSPCPGQQVAGTGAAISGASFGEARLQTVTPQRAVDGAFAEATLLSVFRPTWSLTTHAVCMDRQNAFFVDFESSPRTSDAVKSESVTCDIGALVHGAGARLDAPPGVAIAGIIPTVNLRTVSVFAVESVATSSTWRIFAEANCGA
ncbi:MAG TPA: hypothetical protein VGX25_27635 [Actinophytocola sp.]|uniref:hypothetical protein n=1 Tax=Actinophytocola sp. TaxID=1872138 RepID=UPI002DDD217E|nr:hypothetical protein [Actinophytocola sp.]HEV2783172.1 hypothetical protein [Actinophytocola sp.]